VSENERLRKALRNILNSGVTDIDSRIDYIEVQVDRDDWIEAGQTLYKEPETCTWTHDGGYGLTSCDIVDDFDGTYLADIFRLVAKGATLYCPGCRSKIEVRE